ncbi:glyoxylase-like metal-dependent hydrolase (beta-lactamase superfamily II) [Breoghania corrubedonensis]|uniref:Glyoxylase-like metal-dependent hydrolase (Beta-lactamase superfamily II) n=1 Tax=Breoghania corrubedonensis TaxID=665038 RepID=A0A2T5V4Z9_9HYPH|nr:MBL fold metallo-hydrolase [Breoghania corrubedonensis]PTW58826.1 glyoxylase-like metal-dependent hydrolase (beta-lactamase superfamily II) [Breoghania corrubedonensis]
MSQARFDVLVPGSSLAFEGGFFGISSIVLVEAGGKRALFDVGHGVTRRMLLEALAERSLTPRDIDLLIFSHGHFDHVLNMDLFPNAPIVMGREEYDYIGAIFEDDQVTPRYLPALLDARAVEAIDGEVEILPGVVLFPTPGHSPGHVSLELESAEGPVVLAADALKTAREASTGIPDMEIDPRKRGRASIQEVLRRGRIIVPGHFPTIHREADGRIWWDEIQKMPLLIR